MTKMLELAIDKRVIMPIRLIPYATGWFISPDVLVQMLSKSEKWYRVYIPSYHLLPDKSYKSMLPKEWDVFDTDLTILSDKLHASDLIEGESYPAWRKQSIAVLPPSTFTWLDEFKKAYARMESRMIRPAERPGDRSMNLEPFIPHNMRELVYEGFEVETDKVGSPEWRREVARNAANTRHNQPGGSRDKQKQICDIWATGKYTSRDRCAEEECAALAMSFAAARTALRNTPDPDRST